MFSINGVPLDNDQYHWSVQSSSSQPFLQFSRRSVDLIRGDRSGNVKVPAGEDAPILSLVVRAPRWSADRLMALFGRQFHTISYGDHTNTNSWRATTGEVMSIVPTPVGAYAENTRPDQLIYDSLGASWIDYTICPSG
jgi:hypothetical protein